MKLITKDNEYFLLENSMAKNVGDFFGEKLLTGDWDVFEVHSMNDTVHDGYRICASTRNLPNVKHLDKEEILVHLRKKNLDYLYNTANSEWTDCDGCDENDKGFWINGFMHGYKHKDCQYTLEDMKKAFQCKYIEDFYQLINNLDNVTLEWYVDIEETDNEIKILNIL